MKNTPEILKDLGVFDEGKVVLDIGCGMANIPLWCLKNKIKIKYLGIDVRKQAIEICRNIIDATDMKDDFHFEHLNIYNAAYNQFGKMLPELMNLPVEDDSVNAVICHSLFTHLDTEAVAIRYMREIDRVLRKGGILWTSWFLFPPNIKSEGAIRTVYDKKFVDTLLKDYEMLINFGGETDGYHDQWYVGVRK